MEKQTRKIPAYVMLMLVAIVMSFAIAGVYMTTKDTIAASALQAQAAARSAVMPGAADMGEVTLEDGAPVDSLYLALDANGSFIGYVSQITVIGFGGEIEVTVGMDASGVITGVSVGGSGFSETSGLGAKTREPVFTDQFRGASGVLVLKQDIDSVSGASISSGAVVSGVNKAVAYMTALLPEDPNVTVEERLLSEEAKRALGIQNAQWMGGGSGINGWWRTDGGYIVQATGFGEGPIVVTMAFDANGVVTGILIGSEDFMETEGRGALILEEYYWSQFIGRSGAQEYGADLDAISGATVTSDAVLSAINACMTFDPASGESAAPADTASAGPDAVTEASIPEEEASAEPAFPEPGAVTEATAPEEEAARELITITIPAYSGTPDAVTEATAEAEPTPTPAPIPDAVTEASVVEEG